MAAGSVLNLLVLGGTADARRLAGGLAARPDLSATLSLAGVTRRPRPQPIATRHGGFGGVAGLETYLATRHIDLVIDATHPFAARISAHAEAACRATGRALWQLLRPPWTPRPGEHWITVDDAHAAAEQLATLGPRVFLSVGARSLAPFDGVPDKRWLIRSIEPVAIDAGFADATCIQARPPFSLADEIALLDAQAIDVLVTKNSGSAIMRAKLEAARRLGVKVVMIQRPRGARADQYFEDPDALLAALDTHQKSAGYKRGV